jgi:hypothetical protein
MMYDDQETTAAVIQAALKRHASKVTEVGPGAWGFQLSNGARRNGTARAQSGWLTLDMAVPTRATPYDPWALLQRNAHIGAGVKFALAAVGRTPRLFGELPLDGDEPAQLDQHVGALLARVKDASANLRRTKAQAERPGRAAPEVPPVPVAQRVEEAGWPFTDRLEGRVAVELEGQRRFVQAEVAPTAEGGVSASAPLTDGEAPPAGASREALAVLLLRISAAVRLVRAAAIERPEGGVVTRLETVLPPNCGAEHVHHALSALSVACRLCVLEAELLHDDAVVAETCLASWDGPGG